jgi:type II secretory pathway component PulF
MSLEGFQVRLAKMTFGTKDRLRTWQKISVMLKNKIGIDQILLELYNRESDNGKKPSELTAIVYDEWRKVILNGGRFSDAIEGWVPTMERMIIMAGEQSGNLPKALKAVIDVVRAGKKIKGTVIKGLVYPAILMAATLGYLFLFGIKVIPEFTRIMDVQAWGPMAKSLYHLSEFVINYGVMLIAGIFSVIGAVVWSLPVVTGKLRIKLDKLPPWSLYRLVLGSGFMFSMAALLNGGGRVSDAFATIAQHSNKYMRERVESFLYGVHSGMNAGDAMAESGYDFPSKDIVADLGVYASYSGDFGDAIEKVAQEWMENGLEAVEGQMKFLNGLATFAMAMILMWIVGGFFAIQQEIGQMTRQM